MLLYEIKKRIGGGKKRRKNWKELPSSLHTGRQKISSPNNKDVI